MAFPAIRLAVWAESEAQRRAVSRVRLNRAMSADAERVLGEVGAWKGCRFDLAPGASISMYDEELNDLVERIAAAMEGEGTVVADGCIEGLSAYCHCVGYFGGEIKTAHFAQEISGYDAASAWLENCATSELNRRYVQQFGTSTAGGKSRSAMMDALADRIDEAMQGEDVIEEVDLRRAVKEVRNRMQESGHLARMRLEVPVSDLRAWIRFAGFRLNSRETRRVRRLLRLEGLLC